MYIYHLNIFILIIIVLQVLTMVIFIRPTLGHRYGIPAHTRVTWHGLDVAQKLRVSEAYNDNVVTIYLVLSLG